MLDDGASALHAAVKKGDAGKVRVLLAKGADIEATDIYGDRPLCKAARQRNCKLAQLLLENGASVDAINARFHSTALHEASSSAARDVVELLLRTMPM